MHIELFDKKTDKELNAIFSVDDILAFGKNIGIGKSGKLLDARAMNSCPILSDNEKSLLIQIDVEGKKITEVPKSLGKACTRAQKSLTDLFRRKKR